MMWSKIEERPATPGARLRLNVEADPQVGKFVREQVLAFAGALDIAPLDLGDFLTALGEALANAIEHSGSSDPIEISVWLVGESQLVATVVDRGIGFEPPQAAIVEPHLPEAYAERGRGLPIMRSCTDIFSVRSAPGRGTAVTLGRYVRRPPAQLHAAG